MKSENSILKIVVTGPECSGKTTLALDIANALSEPLVIEYAREYLKELNRVYCQEDLLPILKGQITAVNKALRSAKKMVIIDTGPEVIQIWHRDKFGPEPIEIAQLANAFKADLYLLCKPNIPFEPDSLREDEHRREELFIQYEELLTDETSLVLEGDEIQRLQLVLEKLNELFCKRIN